MNTDERVARMLGEWRARRDRGEAVDAQAVIDANPDIADRLRAEFSAMHLLNAVAARAVAEGVRHVPEERSNGDRIGPYRLRELVGRGGTSSVYRAQQEEPIRRTVAVKFVDKCLDSVRARARFDIERETLALMDHPNIASVLDAGVTERGHPYVVMEYVDGENIIEYANHQCMDLKARLELFCSVCAAIHHAHLKGIIHRDLKPANVMVTEVDGLPMPKVIDFGLAKAFALEGRAGITTTQEGQMLGTPAYMSPEQASGQALDARTDVYSLGMLLYELLTDDHPWGWEQSESESVASLLRRIIEEKPQKPSTMVTTGAIADQSERMIDRSRWSLRGDLDSVVLKTLEKDPGERYASAQALAEDLRRSLRHEPVEAAGPSLLRSMRSLARRHRIPVIAALAVAVSLVAATVVSVHHRADAVAAQKIAESRGVAAERLVDFMVFDLKEKLEPTGRLDVLADVAEQALAHYQGLDDAHRPPEARRRRAAALGTLAEVLQRREQSVEALAARDAQITELERAVGRGFAQDGELENELLRARLQRALLRRTRPLDRTAMETSLENMKQVRRVARQREVAAPHDLNWTALRCEAETELASQQADLDLYADLIPELRGLVQAHPGETDWADRLVRALGTWVNAITDAGARGETLGAYREIHDLREGQLQGAPHDFVRQLGVARACQGLAPMLAQSGRFDQSIPVFERAEQMFAELSIRSPTDQSVALSRGWNLLQHARTLRFLGRYDEAITALRTAQGIPAVHEYIHVAVLKEVVRVLATGERVDEALVEAAKLERVAERDRAAPRHGIHDHVEALGLIALAHEISGHGEQARAYLDRAEEAAATFADPAEWPYRLRFQIFKIYEAQGRVHEALGDIARSIAALRRAEANARERRSSGRDTVLLSHAHALLALGRALAPEPEDRDEALRMLEQGHEAAVSLRTRRVFVDRCNALIEKFDRLLSDLR